MKSRHPETPDERTSLPPNGPAGLAHLRRLEEPQPNCPDCAVEIGTTHLDECDVARCTVSGFQHLMCEYHQETGITAAHDACGIDTWTGWWPGTEDCRRLGWMIHADVPGVPSLPDLNRLYTDATWDPDRREFVPRHTTQNGGDTIIPPTRH